MSCTSAPPPTRTCRPQYRFLIKIGHTATLFDKKSVSLLLFQQWLFLPQTQSRLLLKHWRSDPHRVEPCRSRYTPSFSVSICLYARARSWYPRCFFFFNLWISPLSPATAPLPWGVNIILSNFHWAQKPTPVLWKQKAGVCEVPLSLIVSSLAFYIYVAFWKFSFGQMTANSKKNHFILVIILIVFSLSCLSKHLKASLYYFVLFNLFWLWKKWINLFSWEIQCESLLCFRSLLLVLWFHMTEVNYRISLVI